MPRLALGSYLLAVGACGGDSPGITSGLSGLTSAPSGSGGPGPGEGDSSVNPTDGGSHNTGGSQDTDDTGDPDDTGGPADTGNPPGCDGDSPSIPPKNPSPACSPDVPCVNDANCPDGHACNLALDPPACALLFCGAAGTACHDASLCESGLQCHDGRCNPCTFCGDLCAVDHRTDPLHCGCCDNPVPAGGACDDGKPTCPAGQVVCGGACVDLASDPAHCGACDSPVGAGLDCVGGQPGCLDDDFGDYELCGDACVDILSDDDNCTECGASCTFGSCTQYGLCQLSVSVEEAPSLPISCKAMCEAAGLTCYEDTEVGYASYDGWCDSQIEYTHNCTDVPGTETYVGDYCGGSCTCALNGQTCYCLPKPP